MFAHLHVRSWYSFRRGGSSPDALAEQAAKLGYTSLAITDYNGVYGVVKFQEACKENGLKPIIGAEVTVDGYSLVLLAKNRDGYGNLCKLISAAHHRDRLKPSASIEELARFQKNLFCLTGTHESYLWKLVHENKFNKASAWLKELKQIFHKHLFVELAHPLDEFGEARINILSDLAQKSGIEVVATGDVRYAVSSDYKRYDLLTCIAELIDVDSPHINRPKNAENYLTPISRIQHLIPIPEAFQKASEIAEKCTINLLPEELTPPKAKIFNGLPSPEALVFLCKEALPDLYPDKEDRTRAEAQLEKELNVVLALELQEFFLIVYEITQEAKRRGIRCAGRGSAANSIICYLLGITHVCPIKYNLLFERFLHMGRKGTPDIDVDFDTEKRSQMLEWVIQRFGTERSAMTANVNYYRIRSAVNDVVKALGWSAEMANRTSKRLSRHGILSGQQYKTDVEHVLGKSPRTDTLLEMVAGLENCPRHLSQHSGGMVISRPPLYKFTPVQTSANGIKVVQFDKDDVESLGLIKFDMLGLRMMSCVSEAVEMIERHTGKHIVPEKLPLDDEKTFELIKSGQTVGIFQIESQGQMHLLAKNQPENFDALIAEIALFRPGPLQGGMVNPYVERRNGRQQVVYEHPDLEPILKDTYGVIIFQEQVLEVVHQFAGMSLVEADKFRRLMSKWRHPGDMEDMRTKFVESAMNRGVQRNIAESVFEKVSKFVGYGFCRSHAAAFAQTVYYSAWLKAHYPAAYMAAFMQVRPGMYNQMTLEEEALRFGVKTLLPDIRFSGTRYDIERTKDGWAIRRPLTSIANVSTEDATKILLERFKNPFISIEDFYQRVPIHIDKMEHIARSGALDHLTRDSRTALWEVGVIHQKIKNPGFNRVTELFETPLLTQEDMPDLPQLKPNERIGWDYQINGSGRSHPMILVRRQLQDLEVRTIETTKRLWETYTGIGNIVATTAGIVILRQSPATAKGFLFLTLEDETGFMQCIVHPQQREMLGPIIYQSALIIKGPIQGFGEWRSILIKEAWMLNNIFGGYEGRPSENGGRDHWVKLYETVTAGASIMNPTENVLN